MIPIEQNSSSSWTRLSRRRSSRRAVQGFTLLEVIVAIGITTLIIGAIGTAIRMYFINLRQVQANMELTELARNTLNLMAGDIRSAIQYKPVDVSGLQELLDSQAAAVAGPSTAEESSDESSEETENEGSEDQNQEGENGAGNENEETQGEESSQNQSGASSQNAKPSSSQTAPEPPKNRPKFIGTNQSVYVDMSRLPRIDQYHPILHLNSSGSYTSLPTDVKGVSYFVSLSGDESSPVPGGLYRREVDRATNAGDADSTRFSLDAAAKQVAAEIVVVTLRYFDGESWQDEWDSDETGGYPSAVEITIVIDPRRANQVPGAKYDLRDADTETLRTFRTVTKLPLAEILTAEEQELIANPTEFQTPSGESPTPEGDR